MVFVSDIKLIRTGSAIYECAQKRTIGHHGHQFLGLHFVLRTAYQDPEDLAQVPGPRAIEMNLTIVLNGFWNKKKNTKKY